MNWNRRAATWVGLALLVLTNAVALGGVAYNRSGEPDAVLKLGERELSPPYVWNDKGENSGLSLKLQWRGTPPAARLRGKAAYWSDRNPAWLDARKMRELGFAADAMSMPRLFDDIPASRHRALPRDVLCWNWTGRRTRTRCGAPRRRPWRQAQPRRPPAHRASTRGSG